MIDRGREDYQENSAQDDRQESQRRDAAEVP
jgi:hypothetical protein